MMKNEMNMLDGTTTEGIPYTPKGGRPTVIYHPAAGGHWIASWQIAASLGTPFVLVANDIYPHTPDDGLQGVVDAEGNCPFQKVGYTDYHGSKLYHNVSLDVAHWLEMNQGDGGQKLASMPLVDILYVDWLDDWLPTPVAGLDVDFSDYAKAFAHKVRDGGLILLDLKHSDVDFELSWFDIPPDSFEVHSGVTLEHLGFIIQRKEKGFARLNGASNQHNIIEVFKVHNDHLSGEMNEDVLKRLDLLNWFATIDRVFCTQGAISEEVNA